MPIALLTTYLSEYRLHLYRLLAQRHRIEVLCYGGGERYVPAWFSDLDAQLQRGPVLDRAPIAGRGQVRR